MNEQKQPTKESLCYISINNNINKTHESQRTVMQQALQKAIKEKLDKK